MWSKLGPWREWWAAAVVAVNFCIGVLFLFSTAPWFVGVFLGLVMISAMPLILWMVAEIESLRDKLDGPGPV